MKELSRLKLYEAEYTQLAQVGIMQHLRNMSIFIRWVGYIRPLNNLHKYQLGIPGASSPF